MRRLCAECLREGFSVRNRKKSKGREWLYQREHLTFLNSGRDQNMDAEGVNGWPDSTSMALRRLGGAGKKKSEQETRSRLSFKGRGDRGRGGGRGKEQVAEGPRLWKTQKWSKPVTPGGSRWEGGGLFRGRKNRISDVDPLRSGEESEYLWNMQGKREGKG